MNEQKNYLDFRVLLNQLCSGEQHGSYFWRKSDIWRLPQSLLGDGGLGLKLYGQQGTEPPAIQQVSKAHLCLIMFCACVSVCVETHTETYISPLTQNIKP